MSEQETEMGSEDITKDETEANTEAGTEPGESERETGSKENTEPVTEPMETESESETVSEPVPHPPPASRTAGAKAGQARAEGCSYGTHLPDAARRLPPGKDDQLPQHPALQQSLHLRAALRLCSIRRVDTGNKIHPAEKALLQCLSLIHI